MSKVTRGKFDESTTTSLKVMVDDLKSRGKHVKLAPSDLACWIVCYFEKELYGRKKELLYYSFSDDSSYATQLIKSKVPLKDIEKSLKEFRRKKAEIMKKTEKPSKIEASKSQLHTSASEQRKVGFE